MKPKHGRRRKDEGARKFSEAEEASVLHYRSKLVEILNDLHLRVGEAPPEMNVPRKSIQGLLMASFYLLDVHAGFVDTDANFIRSAIQELEKALAPLGLGIDYWDKINAWRARDLKERGDSDFLLAD